MTADVGEAPQDAGFASHQQDRHARDLPDHMVAGLGKLAAVRHQLPAAREYRALLQRERRLARVIAGRHRVGVFEIRGNGVGRHDGLVLVEGTGTWQRTSDNGMARLMAAV